MTVRTIGVPMDLGADRRGVDMGPSAIRYAGLAERIAAAGHDTTDVGDLHVPRAEEQGAATENHPNDGSHAGTAKYLGAVESVCDRLAGEVADAIAADALPLVLGGDHSIAVGSLRGAARTASLGAIWFDAHADFNTPETSPSGNVHGMGLAAALGEGSFEDHEWATAPGLAAENVALVGLRSLDDREREALRASDVTAYPMSEIDERGVVRVVEDALDVATRSVEGLHVSLDLDWLDPRRAPGVGTPVRGGVTYREAHSAMETVAERDAATGLLRSLELVEVNPILDEHNETAALAAELAASALGERVL